MLETNEPVSYTELLRDEAFIIPNPHLELMLPPCTAQVLMFQGK